MGVQESAAQYWVQAGRNEEFTLLRNPQGDEVESYTVQSYNDQDKREKLGRYKDRREAFRTAKNVVHVLNSFYDSKMAVCVSEIKITVLVERVAKRLSEVELSEDEALFVLHEVLSGYRDIARLWEYNFKTSLRMMGITPSNEVRVWHNSSFKELDPQLLVNMTKEKSSRPIEESKLVAGILKQIESITQEQKFSEEFATFFSRATYKALTFDAAILAIKDYAKAVERGQLQTPSLTVPPSPPYYPQHYNSLPSPKPTSPVTPPLAVRRPADN